MIGSLKYIPDAHDDRKGSDQEFYEPSQSVIDISSILAPKMTINYIEEAAKNYMRRGGLNSDGLAQLIKSNSVWKNSVSQKDYMLLDILGRQAVDLRDEEIQYMTIYILRKKFKNDLEVNFLSNLLKNLAFFSSNEKVGAEAKESSSIKKISHTVYLKSYSRHETIFHTEEKGKEFFTVIKGSALCLVPDPSYKKWTKEETKKIQIIKEQIGESKAETAARSFLNIMAFGVNKKLTVENNVKSFIGNLKTKLIKSSKGLVRSSTKQLEDILSEEEALKNHLTDTEFLKKYFPGFIHVKTFVPGESFGEIALLTSQKRTATLVSRENSSFMVIGKEDFDKTMNSLKKNEIREKIEFIKGFHFFSHLTTRRILQIIQQTKILNCDIKQNIYEEGDHSNFIFLIKEGEIELRSRHSRPEELAQQLNFESEDENHLKELDSLRIKRSKLDVKKMVTIKILGKGGYFGEEEIAKEIPLRQSTAICHSQNTQIFALEKNRLLLTIGINIFDKFKDQITLKDEIKEERLKNAIKMQIPQKDIENLSYFLEQGYLAKEREEQKEKLKIELSQKLKMNFSNRFEQEKSEPAKELVITDNDLLEYNDAKALVSSRKAFSKIQQIKLTPDIAKTNAVNIMIPIFNAKEIKKSQRNIQNPEEQEGLKSRSRSRYDNEVPIQKSRTKFSLVLDNPPEEYIQMSGQTIQVQSFANLFEIEERPKSKRLNAQVFKPEKREQINLSCESGVQDENISFQEEECFHNFTNYNQNKPQLTLNKTRRSIIDEKRNLISSASCKNTLNPQTQTSNYKLISSSTHFLAPKKVNFINVPSSSEIKTPSSTANQGSISQEIPLILIEDENSQGQEKSYKSNIQSIQSRIGANNFQKEQRYEDDNIYPLLNKEGRNTLRLSARYKQIVEEKIQEIGSQNKASGTQISKQNLASSQIWKKNIVLRSQQRNTIHLDSEISSPQYNQCYSQIHSKQEQNNSSQEKSYSPNQKTESLLQFLNTKRQDLSSSLETKRSRKINPHKEIAPHQVRQRQSKICFDEAQIFQTGFSHFRSQNIKSSVPIPPICLSSLQEKQSLIVKPSFSITPRNNEEEKKLSQHNPLSKYLQTRILANQSEMIKKQSRSVSTIEKKNNIKMRAMIHFRRNLAAQESDSSLMTATVDYGSKASLNQDHKTSLTSRQSKRLGSFCKNGQF